MSAKTIYKTLAPFFDAVDGTEEKALKFTAPGYMDLCIEALGYNDHEGRPVYSVAGKPTKYYPAMKKDLAAMVTEWAKNIKAQGFNPAVHA